VAARGSISNSSAARWGTFALLVVGSLGVGTLVASAYEHAAPIPHSGEAAPVPTFTLGVRMPTATLTPTPTPASVPETLATTPRDAERFLEAGSNVWWRGVAGQCGQSAPVLERSIDGGASWQTVTPLSIGASQIASLDAFEQTEAELVVGLGSDCSPTALRTYTQGEFWESYPDVLTASRFVTLADPSTVQLTSGSVASPCAQAHGLRARGDRVTLVCDGSAYIMRAPGEWAALAAPDAAAVAIDGDTVVVAHAADGCAGIALTRFGGTGFAPLGPARCVAGLEPSHPTAIAATDAGTLVWAGETITVIPG
jgi:hypothetical protein